MKCFPEPVDLSRLAMNTCKARILFAIILLCSVAGWSQKPTQDGVQFVADVSGVGTNAAAFLEIGVGGRAMAMGGAYGAVANDVSALYWNPAGIAWTERMQCELMHNDWLVGTNYEFAGLLLPVPALRSTFGISYITLDYGEEPVRTVERPEGNGETFTGRDIAVALSYGIAFTDRFSFGITGKYISERIWSEVGTAAAIDVGIFYNTMVKGLRLGACVNNFGTKMELRGRRLRTVVDPDPGVDNYDRVPVNYKTDLFPIPLLFRVGVSYEKKLGPFGQLLLAMDVNHPSNATESVNLGLEYGFANMFYLRGGYASLFERDAANGLTLGGGVSFNNRRGLGVRVDYAWNDWGVLDHTQRFSLGLSF
jgi:hypothetical protein